MLFRALRKKEQPAVVKRPAVHAAVAFLPVKTGEQEIVESFARPLRDRLLASALGDLAGYKKRPGRSAEPSGIELHLRLASEHPRALQSVANMLDDMDAPVGSTIEFCETGQKHLFGRTEGLALDVEDHPDWLDIVEACTDALAGTALYQGSRVEGDVRSLYFYGEDFHAMQIALAGIGAGGATRRLT